MIETVELDLANVGLGALHETALLRIFASAQARRIVAGTGLVLSDIVDVEGRPLYPAFFKTALEVRAPLDELRTWQKVEIGVDVARFGRLVLESQLVLGRPGELADDATQWREPRARMRGHAMFITDDNRGGPFVVSTPKEGSIAELAVLRKPPEAMSEFRTLRATGRIDGGPDGPLRCSDLSYPVLHPDAAEGRAPMFSVFTTILDAAEQQLVFERTWPPVPEELRRYIKLAERTIYYFDNVTAGDRVRVELAARFAPCTSSSLANAGELCPALLETHAQLYATRAGSLLAVARTTKVVVVPRQLSTLAQDAARLVRQHGTSP
jgi:probable biosynthetic protein (TIGR04098 family)